MTGAGDSRHALVLGASGLIGRHLVRALLTQGVSVTIAVRSDASARDTIAWLASHGVTGPVAQVRIDFDAPDIVDVSSLETVTEVHNCAGVYRFGMTAAEARAANVGIVERVVDLAASLPRSPRLVHVSGYRVGGQDPTTVPWSEAHQRRQYKKLGAYEASKVESDAVLQARAAERGVPWTIVNPSTVIGDSETGESDQLIGLAGTLRQLWEGSSRALPGGDSTFLPVVTVDHLAAFMAAAAADPAAEDRSYWVLDDDTPPLPDLLTIAGKHLGVRVPKTRVPVSVVQRLPRAITGADPETLSFLSSDRYPTASARDLAARRGIPTPDVTRSLERWAEHLALSRFGAADEVPRRFLRAGGHRTFEVGRADSDRIIVPGLPVNADSWAPVATAVDARAVDLPGLGLSAGGSEGPEAWPAWLREVIGNGRVDLIGHSIGSAAAVLTAARHPERVHSLTLIAPFFLQPSRMTSRWGSALAAAVLPRARAGVLSHMLTGDTAAADLLASSIADLRRGTARQVGNLLSRSTSPVWRRMLRNALVQFDGPVHLVTGSEDPLDPRMAEALQGDLVRRSVIPGAGHHPHLTHPRETATILELSRLVSANVAEPRVDRLPA